MKFKSLALAALSVIAASQAHAVIQQQTGGNSELFFVVANDKGSFLLDTGLNVNYLKSANFSEYYAHLDNLAGFSDFLAAGGNAPTWALAVFDGVGTANYDKLEMITTASNSLVTPVKITNSTFKTGTNNFVGSIAQASNTKGSHPTLANGSSFSAVATPGYFGSSFFNLGQASGNQIGNAIGATAQFLDRKGNAGNLNATTFSYLTGVKASFDGTTLAVLPVPEPSTYALMLAGIAAVTFVGRRRRG